MKSVFLLESILNEVSVADLEKQWVETNKMPREQFELLIKIANNKSSWVTWLGKRVLDGQLNIKSEDVEKWQKVIKIFERFKQRFPVKDINQIKTGDQISEFINKALDIESEMVSKDKATKAAKDEYAEFYKGTVQLDGRTFKIYVLPKGHPENYKVSRALAGDTHWCTASSDKSYWNDYIGKDNLIMFFNVADPKEKYQLHVKSDQFMDRADHQIPWGSNFAREACRWVVEKGLAKGFPRGLQTIIKFEKGLPPKESAPKKEKFLVYNQDGIKLYHIKKFNIKEHYWAFGGLLDVSEHNDEAIGKECIILNDREALINDDGWYPLDFRNPDTVILKTLGTSKEAYEAAKFLNREYNLNIPEKLTVKYNTYLKDPKEFVKAKVGSNLAIYEVRDWKEALKLRVLAGIPDYELDGNKVTYILGESPEHLENESVAGLIYRRSGIVDFIVNNGHSFDSVRFSPEQVKAFVDYVFQHSKITLENFSKSRLPYGETKELLASTVFTQLVQKYRLSDNTLGEAWLIPEKDFYAVANLVSMDEPGLGLSGNTILLKVRDKYFAFNNEFMCSQDKSTIRVVTLFKKNEIEPLRQLLGKYNIHCKMFEQGVLKYFPDLSGVSKEDIAAMKSALRVDKLLVNKQDDLKEIKVPLYRATNGRVVYLNKYALITTWDKVKNSFAKSTTQYTPIIEKWAQGSARVNVYLYWSNGSTWNCTITRIDNEGNITGIIRKTGYGMGMNWNLQLRNIPKGMQVKSSNLNEGFNSDQRRRMKQLAGIREPRSSKFGSTSWLGYLDRV